MPRTLTSAALTLVLGFTLASHSAMATQGPISQSGKNALRVFYLANNVFYNVILPRTTSEAVQEQVWRLPHSSSHEDYAGLSCSSDGLTLAHVSRNVGTDPVHARRTEIVRLDVKNQTILPLFTTAEESLSWPVVSSDGKWIAATAYHNGRDTLAILDRHATTVQLVTYAQSISPHSWSREDDKVFVTATDSTGRGWEVLEYSVRQGYFRSIDEGGRPVKSGSQGWLAYLKPTQGRIEVIDASGAHVAHVDGGFKEIVSWIDDSRLLVVSAKGGLDRLGIVDVRSREIVIYSTATEGEINGACLVHEAFN